MVKLLLIFYASFKVDPLAPVLLITSDPAKSTKYNLPVLQLKLSKSFIVTDIIKIECDLDEV